jgi:hypothetical protein
LSDGAGLRAGTVTSGVPEEKSRQPNDRFTAVRDRSGMASIGAFLLLGRRGAANDWLQDWQNRS